MTIPRAVNDWQNRHPLIRGRGGSVFATINPGDGVHADNGGIIDSYGDNDIDGNGNNNTDLLTVIRTH
jgi:hypothetical protein